MHFWAGILTGIFTVFFVECIPELVSLIRNLKKTTLKELRVDSINRLIALGFLMLMLGSGIFLFLHWGNKL